MVRISTYESRKPHHKTINSHIWWRWAIKQHDDFLRLAVFLLVAMMCGLFVAYMRLLPNLAKTDTPITAQITQIPSKPATTNGPQQNNPLFASTPLWSQDFTDKNYKYLDPLYWTVLVGPAQNSNNEQQYYTDNKVNLHIGDGALHLTATRDSQPGGYQYSSSRIETQDKQTFLYGRIDVTAKLPHGVGTWPAVWLLPANNTYERLSPSSDFMRYKNGGEIDIIEAVGFEPNIVYGVSHTRSDLTQRTDGTGLYGSVLVPNNDTEYQTYTLLWTPDSMSFLVNDKPYFTNKRQPNSDYKTWPFDQPFYLIANLAMGGTWGGMDTAHYPGNGIDNAALPASLDIQSIHYYPYISPQAQK